MSNFADRKARMYPDSGKMYSQAGHIVEVGEAALRLSDNFTGFDEIRTVEIEHLIDLKPSYGFSKLRDSIQTTNATNATVNQVGGEYEVRIDGTEATDNVKLETIERGRYLAGTTATTGVAVRIPTMPDDAGKTIRWGYYNDNDGFGFLADSDGYAVFLRQGGTETVVRRADWLDPMDGNGPTGAVLDNEKMIVYRFDYRWYGQGPVEYKIAYEDVDGRPRIATVHRIAGVKGEPIVDQPNLPIVVEVDHSSVTSGTQSQVYVGGRHYSVLGRYRPSRRVTSEIREGASVGTTSWYPVLAFQSKTDQESGAVTMRLEGFDLLTDQNAEVAIFVLDDVDGTFGALSDVPTNETALQVSTDSTTLSGNADRMIVWRGIVSSAGNNKVGANSAQLLSFDIPHRDTPIVFAVRALSTGASVTAVVRLLEEW